MYIFPEDQRLIYESMRVPFVIYQYVDGQVVPVLLSDGFCELIGIADREEARFVNRWRRTAIS